MSNEAFVWHSEGGGDPPDSVDKQLFKNKIVPGGFGSGGR